MTKHKLKRYFLMTVIGATYLKTIVYSGIIGAINPYTIVWHSFDIEDANESSLRQKFIIDESYEASAIIRYRTIKGFSSYTLYFYPEPVKNIEQIDYYDYFDHETTAKMNYAILMYALNKYENSTLTFSNKRIEFFK